MAADFANELPDELWPRLLTGFDDPHAVEAPAGFDFIDAKERFLDLARAVSAALGAECDVEVWPFLAGATFHGLLQLPPAAAGCAGAASLRVSNFGNLATLYPDEATVSPDARMAVQATCGGKGYRYVPSRILRGRYTGPHRGKGLFARWADRFFAHM